MGGFIYSLLGFIVALSILIAIHEFGHYWVARKCGVKVLKFSIGFGRPLWQRTRGEDRTEYIIAAIPLGGYVKMLDEREAPVDAHERHRAFNNKTLGQRSAIVAAGPVANFLFAIVAYWLIFILGVPGLKPWVGEVAPQTPMAQAGLQADDQIIRVDGKDTPTLEALRLALIDGVLGQNQLLVDIKRDGVERSGLVLDMSSLNADSIQENFLQQLGMTPKRPVIAPRLGEIREGEPAQQAGLQSGDLILRADGEAIDDWLHWVKYLQARPGQTITIDIDRGGQLLSLQLIPKSISAGDKTIGRIGAAPQVADDIMEPFRATQEYSVFAAVPAAVVKTWDMSILTLKMLWKMLIGEASLENISGPISIASYAGQSAQIGLIPFLAFMAIVSVSLGVLNLLPVPVLDGGHLLYYLAEFIKGRPLSEHVQALGQRVGILMLGGLMFLAIFNDLNRLLG